MEAAASTLIEGGTPSPLEVECVDDDGSFLKTPSDVHALLAGTIGVIVVAAATYVFFYGTDLLDRLCDYSFEKADINRNGTIEEAELLAAVTFAYLEINLITTHLAIRIRPPCVAYVHNMLTEHGKPLNKAAFRRSMMIIFKQGLKRAIAQISFYALSPLIADKLINLFQLAYDALNLTSVDTVSVWRWMFGPCTRKLFLDMVPIDEIPIGVSTLFALVLSIIILPWILDYFDEQAQLAVEKSILAEREKAKSRLRNTIRMSLLSTTGAAALLQKKSSAGKAKELGAEQGSGAITTDPRAKVTTDEAAVEVAALTEAAAVGNPAAIAVVAASLHRVHANDAASPHDAAAQSYEALQGKHRDGADGEEVGQKIAAQYDNEEGDSMLVTKMYWPLFGASGEYSGTVDGDGYPHGKGQYKRSDGNIGIYEGDFSHGRLEGSGVLAWNGDKYVGGFVDDRYDGFGISTRRDGSSYQGDFVKGQLHGVGRYTFPSGAVYTGSFAQGKMCGSGRKISADGALVHDGEWANGKPVKRSSASRTPEKPV